MRQTKHLCTAIVLASAAVVVSDAPLGAQLRTEGPVGITVAAIEHLGTRLLQLTKEGFRVDAVAVPDAPFVPDHVVVLLSQSPEAATIDYEVVDDTRLWKVGEDVSTLANTGYVLRGFSVAKPRLPVGLMGYVVVMERSTPTAAPSREYRLVRTTGTAADWKVLEKAGADGFTVIQMYVRPDPTRTAASEIVFICERRRGVPAVPVLFTLKSESTATSLETQVNKLAAQGQVLRAFWASRMYLNALMERPASGPAGPAKKYVIDSDSLNVPDVSSLDGRLINWLRYRSDQRVAAYDTSERVGYEMVSDELPDYDWNTGVRLKNDRQLFTREDRVASCGDRRRNKVDAWLPCEAWRLRDRLVEHFAKRRRAIDARYHRDQDGKLTLDVILREEPAAAK